MFSRGDQDIEEAVIADDQNEPLGVPEVMDGTNRTATRVKPIPEDVQGEYLNRAFSTPYNNSETLDDSEDSNEVRCV